MTHDFDDELAEDFSLDEIELDDDVLGADGALPLDVQFADAMGAPRPAPPVAPPAAPAALEVVDKPARRRMEVDFATGPCWAPAGATTTITIRPQCAFRCEKTMATDSAATPGMGTMIVQVAIGQKVQRPSNTPRGTLTRFFDPSSRANGITFDTAHAWEDIAITVSFVQDCTFNASLFGTAEID